MSVNIPNDRIDTAMNDVKEAYTKLYDVVDKWMCSSQCPCKQIDYWLHRITGEKVLNDRGRTKKTDNFEDVLLVYFTPTGNKKIDYFPGNFQKCYEDWKKDWYSYSQNTYGSTPGRGGEFDWQAIAQADFEKLYDVETKVPQMAEFGFKLIEKLETNYSCAGIDEENKRIFFYNVTFDREVGGIPTRLCSEERVRKEIRDIFEHEEL